MHWHRNHLTCLTLAILIVWEGAAFAFNNSEKMDAVRRYLDAAFAQSDRLVKFDGIPNLNFVCADVQCQKSVDAVKSVLGPVSKISTSMTPNNNAEIIIFFKTNGSQKLDTALFLPSSSSARLVKDTDARCTMTSLIKEYRVQKIILEVTEEEGFKANVFCIMSGFIHGSGLSVSETYLRAVSKYGQRIHGSRFPNGASGLWIVFGAALGRQINTRNAPGSGAAYFAEES